MDTETKCNDHVSIWQRMCVAGVIVVFVVAGILRLNDCDLFNPDSPRYVLYSQSIVDLGEYRATDVPGTPVYSWRPPGLSILLAPVMAIRPYDVVAAKCVVLAAGAGLLWVVFRLAFMNGGFLPAILVTGTIASAPSFLVLSTEVLTEIPYTLGVLVVILILSLSTTRVTDDSEKHHTKRTALLTVLAAGTLAFTPWLRTAGVSLVAAVGLWSLFSRVRRQWLLGVGISVMGLGLLAWRNSHAAGENYVGSLFSRLRTQGPQALIQSGFETIGHYACTIPGLLFPGLTTTRAWYSPLTIDAPLRMALPFAIMACLAAVVVTLALLGMCRQRATGGSLAFLYVLIYCTCLVVWPWRHERFVWPLIPLIVSYLPPGLAVVTSFVPGIRSWISLLGTVCLLFVCGWQSVGCQEIVRANQEFIQSRDTFYATRHPGFYFSGWRRAGEWLAANTPPSARVLTWHAAVGGTSHRFQKRVQFETMVPEKVRQQIESFSARYLVVPSGQFGDGFGWQQLSADPAICLQIVFAEADVVVLEVTPNRTGRVSKVDYDHWLDQQLQSSNIALSENPLRTDLAIRHASLLREAGRDHEAKTAFRDLYSHGVKTARVCSELGWLLYEAREFREAAQFLDMARILPNAEAIAGLLAEGAASARKRMNESPANPPKQNLQRNLNRARSLISLLKYSAAERELALALEQEPEQPEALFLRGKLHHLLGENAEARADYERSIAVGGTEVTSWLKLIIYSEAIHGELPVTVTVAGETKTINPSTPDSYLELAELLQEHGWSGRALAILEQTNLRFPDQLQIQKSLAELYCKFSMPDMAIPLFQQVLRQNPQEELAKKGLNVAESMLIEPFMFPLVNHSHEGQKTNSEEMNVTFR